MSRKLDRRSFCAAAAAAMLPMSARAGAAPVDRIVGIDWRLVALEGVDGVEGVTVTLRIDPDGHANGKGGCNSYAGSARIDGEAIEFSRIASTRAMCDPATMRVEHAYFTALEEARGHALVDGALVLRDGSGSERARFVRAA